MPDDRCVRRPCWLVLAPAALVIGLSILSACARGPAAKPTYVPGTALTRAIDGTPMMYVPAGEFCMGSTGADPKAADDEKPARTVYLDAFWIDRTEVTNAQYVGFLNALGGYAGACEGQDCVETKREDADGHILRSNGQFLVESGFEQHPVTEVTWYGAQAYCAWAGARLPTEAEWEKAARGVDGRIYPWGNAAADCSRAQFAECSQTTVPVGSKSAGASPYGLQDMAGNVWEWVSDWYDRAYYAGSPTANPQGAGTGDHKVFRGGSWGYLATFIRTTERASNSPLYAGFNIGFRCAAQEPPTK